MGASNPTKRTVPPATRIVSPSITYTSAGLVGLAADRPADNAAGVPPGVVLMDTSYGNNSKLRQDLTGLGLSYVDR